jgi:hypothetical protein
MPQLAPVALPPNKAFAALTSALGVGSPRVGEHITSRNAPVLDGVVNMSARRHIPSFPSN